MKDIVQLIQFVNEKEISNLNRSDDVVLHLHGLFRCFFLREICEMKVNINFDLFCFIGSFDFAVLGEDWVREAYSLALFPFKYNAVQYCTFRLLNNPLL